MQKFEYVFDGQILNNIWQVKKIEKDTGCFVPFQTDLTEYKKNLLDREVNLATDYDLEYAKYLRATKNYIRLFYSGGSDSHNILTKFVDNNIFLDEIVVMTRNLYNNKTLQSCDQEILEQAIPYLQTLTSKQVGAIVFKNYDAGYMKKLYEDPRWMFSVPGGDVGFRIMQLFEYMQADNNKADCQIVGKEKPLLLQYNDKWYATITDGTLIDTASLHNVCMFYLMPENIKSFVVKARSMRANLSDPILAPDQKFKFYKDAITSDYTKNIGKYANNGKSLLNIKDRRALSEAAMYGDVEVITKWLRSIEELKQEFPELVDGYDLQRYPAGKFPFFLDIDSLEIFSQHELIPNGF